MVISYTLFLFSYDYGLRRSPSLRVLGIGQILSPRYSPKVEIPCLG